MFTEANQEQVISFLETQPEYFLRQDRVSKSAQGKGSPAAVRRIDTHISTVLVGDELVFKFKKKVQFPFISQNSPEEQIEHCRKEVELNTELAPGVYQGVYSFSGRPEPGQLTIQPLDQTQDILTACVVMQRLPDAHNLKELSQKSDFLASHRKELSQLAQLLADFHRQRRKKNSRTRYEFQNNFKDNLALLATWPEIEPALIHRLEELLKKNNASIERRQRGQHVLQGHGDLRLDHVYFVDGKPIIIDCIEFNPAISAVDPYEDLAFFTLGLQMEGQKEAAACFQALYASFALDAGGYNLLPLFEVYRACVRIKIDILQSQSAPPERKAYLAERIRSYIRLIQKKLEEPHPERSITVFYGLPATGKSTRAREEQIQNPAPLIGTDYLRKTLLGLRPEERVPPAGYQEQMSHRVYLRQAALARQFLHSGPVFLDGVFARKRERQRIARLGQKAGASVHFRLCEAAPEEIQSRLARRRKKKGLSDLDDYETWLAIQARFETPEPP